MSRSVSFEIVEHVPVVNRQICDLARQVWQQLAAGHEGCHDEPRHHGTRKLEAAGFYAHRFVGTIRD